MLPVRRRHSLTAWSVIRDNHSARQKLPPPRKKTYTTTLPRICFTFPARAVRFPRVEPYTLKIRMCVQGHVTRFYRRCGHSRTVIRDPGTTFVCPPGQHCPGVATYYSATIQVDGYCPTCRSRSQA